MNLSKSSMLCKIKIFELGGCIKYESKIGTGVLKTLTIYSWDMFASFAAVQCAADGVKEESIPLSGLVEVVLSISIAHPPAIENSINIYCQHLEASHVSVNVLIHVLLNLN